MPALNLWSARGTIVVLPQRLNCAATSGRHPRHPQMPRTAGSVLRRSHASQGLETEIGMVVGGLVQAVR